MAALQRLYTYLNEDLADPRAREWWLVRTPWPGLGLTLAYVLFVKVVGPALMRGRPPFELRRALIAYNVLQVAINVFLTFEGVVGLYAFRQNLLCMPLFGDKRDAFTDYAFQGTMHFLTVKYVDFLDTIFMVLRKRDKQISFLHFFHHVSTSIYTWIFAKYLPGGNVIFAGTMNSLVHVVMYSYYLVSALRPGMVSAATWKKHITHMQIVQLIIAFCHTIAVFFDNPCGYPLWLAGAMAADVLLVLVLFLNFYVHAYILPPKKKEKKEDSDQNLSNGVPAKRKTG